MQSKVFLMHNYFSAPISVLSTGAWVQILVSLVLWPCNVQMGLGETCLTQATLNTYLVIPFTQSIDLY